VSGRHGYEDEGQWSCPGQKASEKYIKAKRAGSVAQRVEQLPSKHKGHILSALTQNKKKTKQNTKYEIRCMVLVG
jgi:hypothetical protein